jgi:hypothetical protein
MQNRNQQPNTASSLLTYLQSFFSGTSTSSSSSTASTAAAAVSASSTAAMAASGAVVPAASLSAASASSSSSPMVPAAVLKEKLSAVTREQMYALLMFRNRENNIFSALPPEYFYYGLIGVEQNPNSDIAIALRLAADGEERAIKELIAMLDRNPRLLLQAGNVMTRGGLYVKRVTLYEFFLGAGDPDAAARIAPNFDKIEGGAGQRDRQYARYKPYIDGMLAQTPYDLRPLIEIIKSSSPADVTAILNNDMTHESTLRDALIQFRTDHTPGVLIKPRMHYNYNTLQSAFDLLYEEWNMLSNNHTNYDKCDLVAICVIGYLQRSLPAVDRFAFARAFADKERTLNFKYAAGVFPDTTSDLPLGISNLIYGCGGAWGGAVRPSVGHDRGCLENSCRTKATDLQNLCSHRYISQNRPGA